jgi:hypothetical protein
MAVMPPRGWCNAAPREPAIDRDVACDLVHHAFTYASMRRRVGLRLLVVYSTPFIVPTRASYGISGEQDE